jgi:hypothetical protein
VKRFRVFVRRFKDKWLNLLNLSIEEKFPTPSQPSQAMIQHCHLLLLLSLLPY